MKVKGLFSRILSYNVQCAYIFNNQAVAVYLLTINKTKKNNVVRITSVKYKIVLLLAAECDVSAELTAYKVNK